MKTFYYLFFYVLAIYLMDGSSIIFAQDSSSVKSKIEEKKITPAPQKIDLPGEDDSENEIENSEKELPPINLQEFIIVGESKPELIPTEKEQLEPETVIIREDAPLLEEDRIAKTPESEIAIASFKIFFFSIKLLPLTLNLFVLCGNSPM